MKRANAWTLAAAGVALAALAGCGESEKAASGRPLGAVPQATARQGNSAPQITQVILQPSEPKPGAVLQARAEATDADGDALHFQYLWSVDGHRVDARSATLQVPEVPKGTAIEVEVVASDGRDQSPPASARTRVGNRAPMLEKVVLDPPDSVRIGQPLVAVPIASDPDGDAIRYRYEWRVNGKPVSEERERFSTASLKRGDKIEVRVVAGDGDAESPPMDSPPVQVANSAPMITSTPDTIQTSDGAFRYTVEARDPDGDTNLRYRLVKGPQGAHVDPLLGEFVWQPSRDQVGTHEVEVAVEDGHGGETHQKFELTVRESVANAGSDDGSTPAKPRLYNSRARAAAAAKAEQEKQQNAPPELQPPAAAQE